MLYLIVDPDRPFAEELADKLASGDPTNTVLPKILAVGAGATACDIATLTIAHIEKCGRPAAVFLSSELPDTDAEQMLDYIAKIGEYAPIVPMGFTLPDIINAARERNGMPLCVQGLLAKPVTRFAITAIIARIKTTKRRRPPPTHQTTV